MFSILLQSLGHENRILCKLFTQLLIHPNTVIEPTRKNTQDEIYPIFSIFWSFFWLDLEPSISPAHGEIVPLFEYAILLSFVMFFTPMVMYVGRQWFNVPISFVFTCKMIVSEHFRVIMKFERD